MKDSQQVDFGVVRFQPYKGFEDPHPRVAKDFRAQRKPAVKDKRTAPSPDEGTPSPVRNATFREGWLEIETSTPEFKAMLRFCKARPEAGEYEIRHRSRGEIERGRSLRVKEVRVDETDERVSMLKPYPVRYLIVTRANDGAKAELLWLVGLTRFIGDDGSGVI